MLQDRPPRRDPWSRGSLDRAAALLLTLSALSCTSCITVATADVRARDPAGVSVAGRDGLALLEPGSPQEEAVVGRGTYPMVFDRIPYVVTARRASDRSIVLHCDGCEEATFPIGASTPSVTLLGADGLSLPAATNSVVVGKAGVSVDYDLCMVTLGRHAQCVVDARARLLVPIGDVVEVRRRVEPVRVWGYVMLAAGALLLGATTYGIFSSHDASDREAFAFIGLPPSLFLGGIGLWEALAPVREVTWRPEAAP
jgi:hypothetical protein